MKNIPISLVIEELKQKLIVDINECNLPACIISMILKDLYNESNLASKQQLQMDKAEYDKALEEQAKVDSECTKEEI